MKILYGEGVSVPGGGKIYAACTQIRGDWSFHREPKLQVLASTSKITRILKFVLFLVIELLDLGVVEPEHCLEFCIHLCSLLC